MNKAGNLLSRLALALVIAELVLVLVSWILSAAAVGSVRSLLSSEGIRWLFGHFASMLATPSDMAVADWHGVGECAT